MKGKVSVNVKYKDDTLRMTDCFMGKQSWTACHVSAMEKEEDKEKSL